MGSVGTVGSAGNWRVYVLCEEAAATQVQPVFAVQECGPRGSRTSGVFLSFVFVLFCFSPGKVENVYL